VVPRCLLKKRQPGLYWVKTQSGLRMEWVVARINRDGDIESPFGEKIKLKDVICIDAPIYGVDAAESTLSSQLLRSSRVLPSRRVVGG